MGKKFKKWNPVKDFKQAGAAFKRGDIGEGLKQTGAGIGKTAVSAATFGAPQVIAAAQDRTGAANKAEEDRQGLFNTAVGETAFGGDQYSQAQRDIMNRLISGEAPTVSGAEVDTQMQSVLPSLNQQFSNNPWSTARMKATTNARQTAQNQIQAQKSAAQQSALDALRQEAANRANIRTGQAAAVTSKATGLDALQDVVNIGGSLAKTGATLAAI